jgi:bifunctional non-homologous end joining protein LigD
VGSGFSAAELDSLRAELDSLPSAEYPGFAEQAERGDHVWVQPTLVCEVRYREWRHGSRVRQPVFMRLRRDKTPEECQRRQADEVAEPPEPAADADAPGGPGGRELHLTNLDKVFWPEQGYTKGDLIEYYRAVAPWLLPYLRDRPLVLTRYPDGIAGKSFYQKDAPEWVPNWIRTETVWSEHSQRDIHYFICEDEDALVYLINLGTIPLHVWCSSASDLAHPDWCILDLDPKGAPWTNVVRCARAIYDLCDAIELPTYVKTSGSTGLHVLIPLGRQCTYEQSRNLAGLIARVIEQEHLDLATTQRTIDRRGGRVYLDWLQNRHGQLLVAPLSVRPLPGAPVSMPLAWREVTPRLDHRRFTIQNARRRLEKLSSDPVLPVLSIRPDLIGALERLSERLPPAS